jgi:hypothetical protein
MQTKIVIDDELLDEAFLVSSAKTWKIALHSFIVTEISKRFRVSDLCCRADLNCDKFHV